jgi:hypothetical protein
MIRSRVGLAWHIAYMSAIRYSCNVLMGKPEGKTQFEDKAYTTYLGDNIRMNLKEIEWEV